MLVQHDNYIASSCIIPHPSKQVPLLTIMRWAQVYNPRSSLTTVTFWKNGVLMAIVDSAICFFIPFYATRPNGRRSANDVFSVGKTVFTALLGSVTLEVGLTSTQHCCASRASATS